MLITASNKSNAKRSLKKFGELAFAQADKLITEQPDGRFGFSQEAAIAIRDKIEKCFAPEVASRVAKAAIEAVHVVDIEASETEIVVQKQIRNPFASLFNASASIETPSKSAIVVRDGKKVSERKEAAPKKQTQASTKTKEQRLALIKESCCPYCESKSDQLWVNIGISKRCSSCETAYSVNTGVVVNLGYKRDDAPRGYKIQKQRDTKNGITRRSEGSICDRLYKLFDTHGASLTLVDAKKSAEAQGISTMTATIQFYAWRKFNGYNKK